MANVRANSIGILLVNLGTPAAAKNKEIRRFLLEFLSDQRVVELNPWLWQPILRGIILPFRAPKLAHAYQHIWLENGSPLQVYSQQLADKLMIWMQSQFKHLEISVKLAMRYGEPSINQGLKDLSKSGCDKILVVPLYPQYSASTTATVVDEVGRILRGWRNQPELRFMRDFASNQHYIKALSHSVEEYWLEHGNTSQRLLLSYHGIPQKSVDLGDPYASQCEQTTQALAKALPKIDVHMSYQSRFGKQQWLLPYTEPTLRQWAEQGIEQVDIMCPGFTADCLETIEEIGLQCVDAFKMAGGTNLRYIPCLNAQDFWVQSLGEMCHTHLQGWLDCV